MRAAAIILGIVVTAAGCDKTAPPPADGRATPLLDLDARPDVVFQVFGTRSDPRLVPVAAVVGNTLVAIELDEAGWERFDSLYMAPGTVYPAIRGGRETGTVTVTRGMWSAGTPLYSLPGCAAALPMAAVALDDPGAGEFAVELFATTRPSPTHTAPVTAIPADSVDALARRLGATEGAEVDLDAGALSALDFRAAALHTGATARPSMLASYLDPLGGDEGAGRGHTANLLVIADDTGSGYTRSYRHALHGNAEGAEFRRFIDVVDVNGDGIAEIVLEAWRFAGDAAPVVLSWRGGAWRESYRGRGTWCLDRDAR